MRKYCEVCGKEVNASVVRVEETYTVYGEPITIEAQVVTCPECGEDLYDEELDNSTLLRAYARYRKNHKLLLPDEIKEIREQYGLSQRSFAKLLNWGDKTIHRYENGSLQDKAHNSLLLFLREPNNMRSYLSDNEVGLDTTQRDKLQRKVDALLSAPEEKSFSRTFAKAFFPEAPSIENGFKSFDFEKLYGVVLYFANRCPNLLKVKLLKLLNYSDMLFYKENGVSITGLRYVHLPYGPVPKNYDLLFGMMEAQDIIHLNVQFENGYERHQVIPQRADYEELLSKEEMAVLEKVYRKFKDYGSVDISNYSHKEAGYRATRQGEVISYAYAREIQLD